MNRIRERIWPAAALLALLLAFVCAVGAVVWDADNIASAQPATQQDGQMGAQPDFLADDDIEVSANNDVTIFYVRMPDGHTYFREGDHVYRADKALSSLL